MGAVALDLVVEPDIDLEIYSAAPDIGKGFTVLAPLAAFPGMRRARFTNTLDTADPGLYYARFRTWTASTPGGLSRWSPRLQ